MYVVKRPFRNFGKVLTVGTVVDPTSIKLFKSKFAEGKIIEVTDKNYEATAKYFKTKYGVDLPAIKTDEAKTDEAKTDEAKTDEVTPVKAVASVVSAK